LDIEWRAGTLSWLQGLPIELEWDSLLVVALVPHHRHLECIIVHLVKVLLVKDLPIYLQGSDSCILDLECLGNLVAVGYDCWHGEGWWHRVIIQSNLVRWDYHGTTRDVNPYWECHGWKSLNRSGDVVIKLATHVIVDSDTDGNLTVRW
jgi:hypothetical protein